MNTIPQIGIDKNNYLCGKSNKIMTYILKKTASKKELTEILKKLKSGKPFNAKKHLGKLKLDIDGVEYQRKLRDEWD
jgi:hypothetical protein